MGKKKASYTAEFKLKVILYADENGKLSAAQQLDVAPKYVRTRCYQKNCPFKKNITWQYSEWLRMAQHLLAPTRRLKRPVNEFCGLKLLIPAHLISKDFKVMGISNALDVTEDSYVDTCYWHYVCCTNWQT
jgi:hypothetical protein